MLSKEESKQFNIDFWAKFKQEMNSLKSSNGKRINWLNYPTQIKHVYLRLIAEKKSVSINLDFQFKDTGVREVFWEQMMELKAVMYSIMKVEASWHESFIFNENQEISRIKWILEDVNFYSQKDHEKIFEFYKTILIRFDEFYQEFKDILIFLAK